jgi:hypothetical protein
MMTVPGFGHRARPKPRQILARPAHLGPPAGQAGGRPLTPAGLRTAEVTARRGPRTPKARLPGGGARSQYAYGRDWQYSAAQAHEAARTGTPRRTTCPLPPGQRQPLQPCGHSGAALSKASGALLLTRRAHNCGAHNGGTPS